MTLPMKNYFRIVLAPLLAVFGRGLSSARFINIGVANGNALSFFPATTNIAVNDQVTWTWNNTLNSHSTTSDASLWDSGLFPAPHSFTTNVFTVAGTYPYHCTLHKVSGMTGSIIVVAPAVPPTLSSPIHFPVRYWGRRPI